MLYHNQPNSALHSPSAQSNKENQRDVVNAFISSVLLGEGKNKNVANDGPRREVLSMGNNQSSVVAEWLDGNSMTASSGATSNNWTVLAVYSEVAIRKLQGVEGLLSSLMKRYSLYYEHHCKQQTNNGQSNNQTRLFIMYSFVGDSVY